MPRLGGAARHRKGHGRLPHPGTAAEQDELPHEHATAADVVPFDQLGDDDAVRSFVSRGLAEWRRGTSRSLDQKVGEGASTFGDLVGDTTAALSIDEIEIGQPPP